MRRFAVPVTTPMPKSEPTDTCVVNTGKPKRLAEVTSREVTRLAEGHHHGDERQTGGRCNGLRADQERHDLRRVVQAAGDPTAPALR
jgi:hypothetical protein